MFFSPSTWQLQKEPIQLLPLCGQCGLWQHCNSPYMKPSGEGKRKVLIVAEAPGEYEDQRGIQLVGNTGMELISMLYEFKVNMRRDCWLTNSLICRPTNEQGFNRPPTKEEISYCRPNLIKTIQQLQPEVIIPIGKYAVESLIDYAWKPGMVEEIGTWVGWDIPCQKLNCWICPTYHPSYLLRKKEPAVRLHMLKHLEQAFQHTSRPWEQLPDYDGMVKVEMNPRKVAIAIRDFQAQGKPVAFDYETTTLKPDGPHAAILCCSVSDGLVSVAFPWLGEAVVAMSELLKSDVPKIAANCFSGETKLLTREYGVIPFCELKDGESITVLNHKGDWVTGVVNYFGQQWTQEVSFARRNFINTVRATDNHNWLLEDGSIIPTKELKSERYGHGLRNGLPDKVIYQTAPKIITDKKAYLDGIRHGIILGDGSTMYKRRNSFRVRLCGKKMELLPYFDGYTRSYPPSHNGDAVVYLTKQVMNLKQPPPSTVGNSYLIGFFRGLMATDGCVHKNGQIDISNPREVMDWCKTYLPIVGYWFQGGRRFLDHERSAISYKLTKDVWSFYLSRESTCEEDFLLSHHRNNWRKIHLGPYKFSGRGERRLEDVYCVTVPEGHSFTLDGGLVTGNCRFEERWTRRFLRHGVKNWQWDTLLGAHWRDCRHGITSLKFQAFVLLGAADYSSHLDESMKGKDSNSPNKLKDEDRQTLLRYCGLDSLLECHVAEVQQESWYNG